MDAVLDRLYRLILTRCQGDAQTSYIAKRFAQGTHKIAQKVGEEAVETVIAAVADDRQGVIDESADLLFHWLMLLADAGIEPAEVMAELERREGISGLDEKSLRKTS